jgi:choline dehydrogenase-like flavoprotein
MMPLEDGGVVDPTLKVYGTSNIRVCDASILPFHLACHPQATVYGLAEKAADIIKDGHAQALAAAQASAEASNTTTGARKWLSSMIWGQEVQA